MQIGMKRRANATEKNETKNDGAGEMLKNR